MTLYVVICREDTDVYGNPGKYVCATQTLFRAEDAAEYVKTIPLSRDPFIVTPEEYLVHIGFRYPKTES